MLATFYWNSALAVYSLQCIISGIKVILSFKIYVFQITIVLDYTNNFNFFRINNNSLAYIVPTCLAVSCFKIQTQISFLETVGNCTGN